MTTNTEIPTHSRLVQSIEDFFRCAEHIAHFAIKRPLGYFHHYIVIGWNDVKNKIIEYYVCFSNMIKGQGEVVERNISTTEVEEAIRSKCLFVIEAPDYPQSESEKKKALSRFWERFGEKAYSLAYNNCEHLVSYILTGNPFSEQIKKAGPLGKLFVDSFDNCISHGKRNMLKISGCLLAAVPVSFFCKAAVTTVVNEVGNSLSRSSSSLPEQAVDCATKNVCRNASKQLGCKSSQILKIKRCTNVARKASKTALKKSAATTFLITGAVEGAFAAYEIYKLRKQRKRNHINKIDFKREVTKRVSGAAGATVGSVGAGLVGQAICPIPVVGFAVGSALGNYVGRLAASTLSGQIVDGLN